jgi:hypothetical protein
MLVSANTRGERQVMPLWIGDCTDAMESNTDTTSHDAAPEFIRGPIACYLRRNHRRQNA